MQRVNQVPSAKSTCCFGATTPYNPLPPPCIAAPCEPKTHNTTPPSLGCRSQVMRAPRRVPQQWRQKLQHLQQVPPAPSFRRVGAAQPCPAQPPPSTATPRLPDTLTSLYVNVPAGHWTAEEFAAAEATAATGATDASCSEPPPRCLRAALPCPFPAHRRHTLLTKQTQPHPSLHRTVLAGGTAEAHAAAEHAAAEAPAAAGAVCNEPLPR